MSSKHCNIARGFKGGGKATERARGLFERSEAERVTQGGSESPSFTLERIYAVSNFHVEVRTGAMTSITDFCNNLTLRNLITNRDEIL